MRILFHKAACRSLNTICSIVLHHGNEYRNYNPPRRAYSQLAWLWVTSSGLKPSWKAFDAVQNCFQVPQRKVGVPRIHWAELSMTASSVPACFQLSFHSHIRNGSVTLTSSAHYSLFLKIDPTEAASAPQVILQKPACWTGLLTGGLSSDTLFAFERQRLSQLRR